MRLDKYKEWESKRDTGTNPKSVHKNMGFCNFLTLQWLFFIIYLFFIYKLKGGVYTDT